MTRRLAFVLAAAALLSGCSTMSGPNDLFGYATPEPGVLASAPGLAAAATPAVQPLPPAPAPAAARAPRTALPPVTAASPIAATTEDGEREQMIATALAPVSAHQRLGELDRNTDGTMVLPEGRSLEIIDIAPIRKSMAAGDDLPAGL